MSEGDEHVEHVEKTMEQTKDSLHDPVKFQSDQDRFYPPEMYVFFHQGPVVIVGQNNVFLLQNPGDMQKALQTSGGGGLQVHHDHGSVDVQTETLDKKKRLVFICIQNTLIYIDTLQGDDSPVSTMDSPSPMTTPATPCVYHFDFYTRKQIDKVRTKEKT